MSDFYTDPWSSGSGDIGLGNTLTYSDIAGPQSDGTYAVPVAAQQVNDPANVAGYSATMSDSTYKLLSQGIGTLGQLGLANMNLDYRRYEATNGGLFRQGYYAGISGNGYGRANQPMQLSTLLLICGLAYLLLKD